MTTPVDTLHPAPATAPRIEDLLRPTARPKPRRILRRLFFVTLPLVLLFLAAYGTGYQYAEIRPVRIGAPVEIPENEADLKRFVAKQQKDAKQLAAEFKKITPSGTYIVIDTTQNHLYIMKDGETVHTAICSAGSGITLKENPEYAKSKGREPRTWTFITPRGLFKIKDRREDPVWTKPDWALSEEGKIATSRDDLIDDATLGEYALGLGDGYMIHGTLYTRLLGRSVTHGCIRLGVEDLRKVWAETKIGTPVYIY